MQPRIGLNAIKVAIYQSLLAFSAYLFVHREIWMGKDYSHFLIFWQEPAALFLLFVDGLLRGSWGLKLGSVYISPFQKRIFRWLLPVFLFLYVASTVLAQRMHIFLVSDQVRSFGIVLSVVSLVLTFWTRLTIPEFLQSTKVAEGDDFSSSALSTNGPWRFLRYPERSLSLLMLAGLGLSFGSWLPLLSLPGAFIALKWEISDMESFRKSQLGAAYLVYSKTNWRLIPYWY